MPFGGGPAHPVYNGASRASIPGKTLMDEYAGLIAQGLVQNASDMGAVIEANGNGELDAVVDRIWLFAEKLVERRPAQT